MQKIKKFSHTHAFLGTGQMTWLDGRSANHAPGYPKTWRSWWLAVLIDKPTTKAMTGLGLNNVGSDRVFPQEQA
jgi:hypothetical protein